MAQKSVKKAPNERFPKTAALALAKSQAKKKVAEIFKTKKKPQGPALPSIQAQHQRMREVLRVLEHTYPDAECSLTFKNPFQLLVAVILSAQCTDERVNRVTPQLFERFPGPREMAEADVKDIEHAIRSINFFRNKAIALHATARAIMQQHGGEVPRELDQLILLRGVGRKTANVVRGVAFGEPGLVVDTHVGRISRRLGFTRSMDPVDVEHELGEIVPRENWTEYAHLMISHGRAICTARRAFCSKCPLSRLCPKIGVGAAAG
jgi:endonuclease-3